MGGFSAAGLASLSTVSARMRIRIVPSGRMSTAAAPCSFAARVAREMSARVNRAVVFIGDNLYLPLSFTVLATSIAATMARRHSLFLVSASFQEIAPHDRIGLHPG